MVHINNLKPILKKGWIAKDKHGKWFWYSQQPYINTMFEDCWSAPLSGFAVALNLVIDIEDDGINWKKSCQKVGV